jgi:hypothetical protein
VELLEIRPGEFVGPLWTPLVAEIALVAVVVAVFAVGTRPPKYEPGGT